ncbi:MAG: MBL fold metallo-hydrolase [Chitinophagaceae bacterium]|nr:MBL fold metallo-hydrolase [Chitinophagaceae bacterium]
MLKIKSFTFNPFQENTYILYNEQRQALIIDPGMYEPSEFQIFQQFISQEDLTPILLLNTHTHLDHLFGNAFVKNQYSVPFAFHQDDKPVFDAATSAGILYNLSFERSPEPDFYLSEKDVVQLGSLEFQILLTPGHSPGSICFYQPDENIVISGDVLFQQSIGRSDLPGGHYETLIRSITGKLFSLPDETTVFSGHGPETSIGFEKMNNPFLMNR